MLWSRFPTVRKNERDLCRDGCFNGLWTGHPGVCVVDGGDLCHHTLAIKKGADDNLSWMDGFVRVLALDSAFAVGGVDVGL